MTPEDRAQALELAEYEYTQRHAIMELRRENENRMREGR